jgi:hypothetical protein
MLDKEGDQIYYVYAHRKNTDNIIFYIGKGKDRRHLSLSGRNQHWKNTANKHGWHSQILKCGISEVDALDLEELIINTIGVDNLCNQNYFNGGMSGFKHSIESKSKMSKSKIGITPWNKGLKLESSSFRMRGHNNPMFGKKNNHSQSTRQKLRESHGTMVCDIQTGFFYSSITEASESLKIGRKTLKLKRRLEIC